MASSPITSQKIDGETMETVTDYFLGLQITADGDCSHEIKRCLLFGRKARTNLDSILKSRDITLQTKVHLVKAMVFPVVMYGCESWTIKKAEHWRIDVFELWCWRRLLRVPWTLSNQSILKEISPKYSCWSWNCNTLATQYEEMTHWKRPWCWERLKEGGERDNKEWHGWMASPTQWTWVCVGSRSWWWTGKPGMLQSMESQRVGHNWVTELISQVHGIFVIGCLDRFLVIPKTQLKTYYSIPTVQRTNLYDKEVNNFSKLTADWWQSQFWKKLACLVPRIPF